ncbi:MAG: hypothetical protein K0R85_66 [Devosia sp.]|jgi:hypothetical protein|nr:hypothetical protein [Devosia sp.]
MAVVFVAWKGQPTERRPISELLRYDFARTQIVEH